MAGATRTIFTDAAIHLIHTHSRGLPRVINNLCTASLLDVYAHEGNPVEPDNAQRAINDLADQ
jgi:type II secretory pathway predicted ATPase ExeA